MRIFAIGWRNAAIVSASVAAVIGLIAGLVSARYDRAATAEMKQAGKALFVRQWTAHDPQSHGDGLGPVFNANSCVACHSQGGVGGGGPRDRDDAVAQRDTGNESVFHRFEGRLDGGPAGAGGGPRRQPLTQSLKAHGGYPFWKE